MAKPVLQHNFKIVIRYSAYSVYRVVRHASYSRIKGFSSNEFRPGFRTDLV